MEVEMIGNGQEDVVEHDRNYKYSFLFAWSRVHFTKTKSLFIYRASNEGILRNR